LFIVRCSWFVVRRSSFVVRGLLSETMSAFPLEHRQALVCGSTQGIGKACAMELARLGASVTLVARNEEALAIAQRELPAPGGAAQKHRHLVADFTDWQALREKVAAHTAAHGPVHILINNTGGPPAGPAFEARPEEYLRGFQMHILCNQVLVQAAAPGMREAGYGRIINIISTSVIQPIRGLGVSNTIRGAVGNWARTLAAELAPFGITVNNILPGFTDTARLQSLFRGRAERSGTSIEEVREQALATIPARRLGRPEEIAAVAGFLATPAAAYVNGVNLPVDGGRLAVQ
jgi:3-oxoacyl-[acyl-carrier protein] reductase